MRARVIYPLCIKFSSKPFEDWDCDLPFTSFGKHSFRTFWCSTSAVFSRATNTSSLIFCLSNSNDYSNNLSCLCARSSACLAANLRLTCSALLRHSLTYKYDAFEDPVAESEDFERALAFFLEGLELCELVALPLSDFELCDVEQKDLEDFEQWESEQYNFSTPFSEKIDVSDWCEELLVLGRLDGLLVWVNNSFWDKLLVSMRYFSGKVSELFWKMIVFLNNVGKCFFLSQQPLVAVSCKIPKFHLIF